MLCIDVQHLSKSFGDHPVIDDLSLRVEEGALYPALWRLERQGLVSTEWGVSDNNRKAKFYSITRAGRKRLAAEEREWRETTEIIDRFFAAGGAS